MLLPLGPVKLASVPPKQNLHRYTKEEPPKGAPSPQEVIRRRIGECPGKRFRP